MQSEQNFESQKENREIVKRQQWQSFYLRCAGIALLGGTAVYLIVRGELAFGVGLLSSVALLASGSQFPGKNS